MKTESPSTGAVRHWLDQLEHWMRGAIRHIYPDRCPGCRVRISQDIARVHGGWCVPCADTCFPLGSPRCRICATPRPEQVGRVYRGIDSLCPRCTERRPAFERADSLYEYTGAVADAIQFIKYAPATWPIRVFEPPMRHWLGRIHETLRDPLVTTVPMHTRDLARRGFHLTEMLLARASRSDTRLVTHRLLRKRRFTPPQAGLTLGERLDNVRGVFEATCPSDIVGRDILLIDDVMTTGATADAAARSLMEAGANTVFVATIARAPSS